MLDIFLIIKNAKNDVRYYLNHVYKKPYNYNELHKIVKNFCSNYIKVQKGIMQT